MSEECELPDRGVSDQRLDVCVVEDVRGPAIESLGEHFFVVLEPLAWSDEEKLRTLVRAARALVVRNRTHVDRLLLEAAPRLEVVARAGVGTDNVDVGAADELGIVVVNAAGANARSVAEHSLALALALARDLVGNDRRARRGVWDRRLGVELCAKTWGIVGLGAAGGALAEMVTALGMNVVGYDPYCSRELALRLGVRMVDDLAELASQADVLSVHVPLTLQTKGLIGKEVLSYMRPTAFLINVARGGVVDEDALANAIELEWIAGAALDVREEEPPTLGRLEESERVIFTPHVAGLTESAQDAVTDLIADDIERVLRGDGARRAVGTLKRSVRR